MATNRKDDAPTRSAIYCRVSSEAQADNHSLPTQEAACREYAEARGWEVAAVYKDVWTGSEVFERPGLSRLRSDMRTGRFDVLLVHALDRLSRDTNHQGLILSEAEHVGVAWHSATEDIDDSPQGKILRAVIGGMAELERLKIVERTQRGKRARVASGRYNPGQKAPYGYAWANPITKDRLVIDPVTGPILRGMFDEIVAGGSLRGVANRLNREGVPTPTGRGTCWYPTTVSVVVSNPVCWGEARAYRWAVEKGKGRKERVWRRDEADHVPLPDVAPPLVTPDVAAAVRSRLDRNRLEATRNNKTPEDALLRAGFAVCGYCGRPLTITHKAPNRRVVYRCNPPNRDRFGCPHFGIEGEILDRAVWGRVEAVLRDPGVVRREVERLRGADPVKDDLAAVDRRLAEIDRRRANLARRVAAIDDDEVAAPLLAEIRSLAGQHSALLAERSKLEAQRAGWEAAQGHLEDLEHWCALQVGNLARLDYAGKRLALTALGVTATVWSTTHSPRLSIAMTIDASPESSIAYTTRRRSTTATRRSMPRGSTG